MQIKIQIQDLKAFLQSPEKTRNGKVAMISYLGNRIEVLLLGEGVRPNLNVAEPLSRPGNSQRDYPPVMSLPGKLKSARSTSKGQPAGA